MSIKEALEQIEILSLEMLGHDSLAARKNYSKIECLVDWLTLEAKEKNIPKVNFNEYTENLLKHCGVIAGLSESNGHSLELHLSWACAEIDKLRSKHCFNT